MDRIKKLELNRLVKEFDYIKSDYTYKHELANEADSKFIISVNEFLSKHPDIKELFDEKINKRIDNAIKKNSVDDETKELPGTSEDEDEENTENVIEEEETKEDIRNPKLRNLYRSIVKLTHPDKVKDFRLNELYIESTKYYDSNDIMGLYSLCDKLFIDYEIEESEGESIKTEIDTLRNRVEFLQNTFTWKWFNQTDDSIKEMIIVTYIKTQIT
jgi:hypothetical protein